MQPFEYSGIWWLPNKPEQRVSGELRFDPIGRTTLELVGSFKEGAEIKAFGPEDIILGFTSNGKVITLYGCLYSGFQITGLGVTSSKYLVKVVFIGHHFPNEPSLLFKSLSINYGHLHEWTRITGFKFSIKSSEDGGLLEEAVTYSFPKEVSVTIDGAKFSFHHRYSSSGDRIQDIILKQTTFWKVEPEKESHYKMFHEQIFYHLQNFLTLAVNKPVRPRYIVGKAEATKQIAPDGRTIYPDIEIYYSIEHKTVETTGRHPHEMLFLLSDIDGHFQTCLSNWFAKATFLASVYDLFFGTMYNDSMYLQQEFITLAQALESYHRCTRGGHYMKAETFQPLYEHLVSSIPDDIESSFRDSIKAKLKYLTEYSLRKRLAEIIEDVKDVLPQSDINQTEIIENIVYTRNYLTHYDESLAEKSKQNEELLKLVHIMRMIIQVLLMIELGLPREVIRPLLKRHISFR